MKLTKEQKQELADKLSYPYGSVRILCDGRLISLQVERFKGMTYRVMIYVDGVFKGAWMVPKKGEDPAPECKYLRKSVRPCISPVKRKKLEKALGKRYVQKDPFYSASYTVYFPDFGSGKAAINHLCKVCDSVEVCEAPGTLPKIVANGEQTQEESQI